MYGRKLRYAVEELADRRIDDQYVLYLYYSSNKSCTPKCCWALFEIRICVGGFTGSGYRGQDAYHPWSDREPEVRVVANFADTDTLATRPRRTSDEADLHWQTLLWTSLLCQS